MVGGKSAEYCIINLEVDDLKAKEGKDSNFIVFCH